MINSNNLEHKTKQQELKMEALIREFERLNDTVDEFFNEVGLTEESIVRFTNTKEHFSEAEWERLNEERAKLEEKFNRQLSLIRDPKLAQKKYSDRNIAPHWLFVR